MNVALQSTLPPPPKTLAIAKHCRCCGTHHTWLDWLSLPNVGLQDDGEGGLLRLRNCGCGSTIGVEQDDESVARTCLFLGSDQ